MSRNLTSHNNVLHWKNTFLISILLNLLKCVFGLECVLFWLTLYVSVVFIVFQLLNHVWLSATPWIAACQCSLSFAISQSWLKLMSIGLMMQPSHPVAPFSSCPQSFPASGSFPMSWLFTTGGQSIGIHISCILANKVYSLVVGIVCVCVYTHICTCVCISRSKLVDSTVQVIYILTKFMPSWSINSDRIEFKAPTLIVDLTISLSSSVSFLLLYFEFEFPPVFEFMLGA